MTFRGIHGTTDYALPRRRDWDRALDKLCPRCRVVHIQDRSTLCKTCTQQVRRLREKHQRKFTKRAAQMTRADILALTAAQMDRARELLGEWREVER